MKTLSPEQHALIDEVKESVGELAAAELECILNGSIYRFHSVDVKDEDVIRAMAAAHGIDLPC